VGIFRKLGLCYGRGPPRAKSRKGEPIVLSIRKAGTGGYGKNAFLAGEKLQRESEEQ